jgi:hypothetical protein
MSSSRNDRRSGLSLPPHHIYSEIQSIPIFNNMFFGKSCLKIEKFYLIYIKNNELDSFMGLNHQLKR